ncbi:MAG TPA: hypothetical protein VHX88_18595 [Solirubrobacteraceae bacterium]|jgi:hypothetical protein|nr:hypothetical protein [Solirubrobacteraceae bacterium]
MTDHAAERPPSAVLYGPRARAFAGTVRDELMRLRGRSVGLCATCGRPVFVQQSFSRLRGGVVHVRCPGAR